MLGHNQYEIGSLGADLAQSRLCARQSFSPQILQSTRSGIGSRPLAAPSQGGLRVDFGLNGRCAGEQSGRG